MSIIENIVEGILLDCSDRRGIKQEFADLDDDVLEEIKEAWAGVIEKVLDPKSTASKVKIRLADGEKEYLIERLTRTITVYEDRLTWVRGDDITRNKEKLATAKSILCQLKGKQNEKTN